MRAERLSTIVGGGRAAEGCYKGNVILNESKRGTEIVIQTCVIFCSARALRLCADRAARLRSPRRLPRDPPRGLPRAFSDI